MRPLTTRDRVLARLGLMRMITPATGGRPADLTIRQTTSRESGPNLGVMHEAKCQHCGWKIQDPPDTLTSCLERGRRHLMQEHGIRLDRMRDVKLGEERWD